MAKRKSITKKVRFEVFKRDSFKCQYCGRSSPDVILEVDHIVPVAKGGTNEMLNLITSCMDCNRGKGKNELSDSSMVEKQRKQLEELNERKQQMKMMLEWKAELSSIEEDEIEHIQNGFKAAYGVDFTPTGRANIKKLIKEFGFGEVLEAFEIATERYMDGSVAFDKLGGICYNRKVGRGADYYGNQENS